MIMAQGFEKETCNSMTDLCLCLNYILYICWCSVCRIVELITKSYIKSVLCISVCACKKRSRAFSNCLTDGVDRQMTPTHHSVTRVHIHLHIIVMNVCVCVCVYVYMNVCAYVRIFT